MDLFAIVAGVTFPLIIFFVMFGMGLALETDHFRPIITTPQSALVGFLGQMVLLPTVALVMVTSLSMPAEVAVGLILLAACPGGISSNAIVFAARADLALSVTLTVFSSLCVSFTLPIWVAYGFDHYFAEEANILLPFLPTVRRLATLTILPLGLGMLLRYFKKSWAVSSTEFFRKASIALIMFMVVFSAYSNRSYLQDPMLVAQILAYCCLLLLATMAIGYVISQLLSLSADQKISIVIEIGVQNVAMGLLVATTMLNNPEITNTPLVYGITMFAASWIAIRLCRKHHRKLLQTPKTTPHG